jgi:putative MATE family efflux protein
MFALALPVLVEQSLTLLVGYTDWWLTGHFLEGAEYKAAMGLLAYALWLVPSLFAAAAIGATALVSRSVGEQDALGAARATKQALLLGCGLAAVVAIAGMLLGRPFIAAMQLRGEAAELAWQYLAIVVPFAPAIAAQQIVAASLRGAGDTVSGMLAQAAVNAVNMTLGPALVTGWWIFPQLGWRGLAIGTAAGYAFAAAVLLARLFRRRSAVRMKLATGWRVEPELMKRLLRIGLPGGLDVLAIVSCHLAYLAIINRLGDLSAAAHGLGVQIEALGYLPGTAFQVAAATFVGQSLGAGQPDRAQRGALAALAAGASIMTLAGLAFFFAGHSLADFFAKPGDQAGELAGQLLKVVAFSMPSLATTMILTGALRGAGDTRWPLAITLVSYLGVRLPGAAWLAWSEIPLPFTDLVIPGMALGVFGAWYAMVADVALRSILIAARFIHGGWKRIVVN